MKYEPKQKEIPGMPGTKLRKSKRIYTERERQEILDRLTSDSKSDAAGEDDDFVPQEQLL